MTFGKKTRVTRINKDCFAHVKGQLAVTLPGNFGLDDFMGIQSGELYLCDRPACAIVSMKDLELIEALKDQIDIKSAKKAHSRKTSIPWGKAKKTA